MLNAALLSLLAGLATAVGGLIPILVKKVSKKFLGLVLGFSSGVMIIIAIQSLFLKSVELGSYLTAMISFVVGAFFILLLDTLVSHEYIFKEKGLGKKKEFELIKVGLLLSLGVGLHNFPEGMVVGIGYTMLPVFGLMLAVAIAFHNIPEGLAVAVPLIGGGMEKSKVLFITLLSGLAEPLGALVSLAFLRLSPGILPSFLGFTGGIMVYLTMDELLPAAREYGHPHALSIGIIFGLGLALFLGYIT